MPFQFRFKDSFQKDLSRLSAHDYSLVLKTLDEIESVLKTGSPSQGLRIKKLHGNPAYKIFEARASINLRIVWTQTKSEMTFALLGNHEDVRRFIKNL